MSAKTERIEVRADETSKSRISEAAELLGEPVSAFMVRSARAEADKVLAGAHRTVMPAELFDQLIAALDEPDEPLMLTEIANRPRRFRRA